MRSKVSAEGSDLSTKPETTGVAAAVGAYGLWGSLILYWPLLEFAGTLEILAHRFAWGLFVVLLLLTVRGSWSWVRQLARRPRTLAGLALAGALIAVNWGTFVWGATHHHVVEVSLGYYINPLVSVVLGVVVLRERLDTLRWIAVAAAAIGVAWLTIRAGAPPWLALILSGAFGGYGLVKKLVSVPSLEGVAVETAAMLLPSLAYLGWLQASGAAHFGAAPSQTWLLASSGIATTVPLVLFGMAATRIPLNLIGMLQYLTPTLMLLLGVLVLGEPIESGELVGFGFVWLALLILTVAQFRRTGPQPGDALSGRRASR